MSAAREGRQTISSISNYSEPILCSCAFDCLGIVGHSVRAIDRTILILRQIDVRHFRERERALVIDIRAAGAAGRKGFNDEIVELDLKKRLGSVVAG